MTPPTVLLAALEVFLRDELSGPLDAYQSYQARIAANLLALLRREAEQGAALAALDREFAARHGLDEAGMPAALSRALRDGELPESVEVRDYLRRRSLLSLAIDNPRYSGYRQALSAWSERGAEAD